MDRQYSIGAKTGADIILIHPLRNRTTKFGNPDGRGGILKYSQITNTAPIINSTASPGTDWAPAQNAQTAPPCNCNHYRDANDPCCAEEKPRQQA